MSSKDIERMCQITGLKPNEPWPIGSKPENIMVVVAGGEQSGHCYWMQSAFTALQPVTVGIDVPAGWDKLIKQSERDSSA